jgi:signal transduction histidine kinase
MENYFSKQFQKVYSFGVHDGLMPVEVVQIRLLNMSCIIGSLLCIVSICYKLSTSLSQSYINFMILGLLISVLILHKNQLYRLSRILVYYPLLFIITKSGLNNAMTSANYSSQYSLVPILIIGLIIYSGNYRILAFISAILCKVIIEVARVKYWNLPIDNVWFTNFLSSMSILICVYFVTINYKKGLQKLSQTNEELIRQRQIVEVQSEELKSINSTKDRLFSIIAHDLRSPLSSLKGVMQLLDNEYISKEEFKELSKRLQQNVDNVHGMLENLLLWSFSQMKGIKPNVKPFDLNFIIDETVQLFKEISMQKQIDLTNNSAIHFQALGDEYQIRTVLRNLLNNALKFTPSHGEININSTIKGQYVNLKISDSGIGIKQNDLAQIFSNPTLKTGTAGEKGTGFGLFLCKELIEKNGGSIDVNSEFGKGTIIELLLPIA